MQALAVESSEASHIYRKISVYAEIILAIAVGRADRGVWIARQEYASTNELILFLGVELLQRCSKSISCLLTRTTVQLCDAPLPECGQFVQYFLKQPDRWKHVQPQQATFCSGSIRGTYYACCRHISRRDISGCAEIIQAQCTGVSSFGLVILLVRRKEASLEALRLSSSPL